MTDVLTTLRQDQLAELADLEPTDRVLVGRGEGPLQAAPAQAFIEFMEANGVGAENAASALAAAAEASGSKTAAQTASSEAQAAAEGLEDSLQRVRAAAFTYAGFIQSNGVFVASDGLHATGFIRVEGGVEYTVKAGASGNAHHAWYDADQVFISTFRGPGTGVLETSAHTAPANARFARLSTASAHVAASTFAPSQPRLSIEQIKEIAERHPPTIPAKSVTFGATTADAQMTAIQASLDLLQDQQADALNELDLLADDLRPIFIQTNLFTKSYLTAAPVETIAITARDSATQFTVAAGKGSKLAAGGAVVVHDAATDRYWPFGIKSIAGDVVTVFGQLPATCSSCETMHEGPNGQHLGRYGHKALAEFVLRQVRKYAVRKKSRLFTYHPTSCTTPAPADPDIYDRATGATKLIDVTVLGGAGYGGWVEGTTNLARCCQTLSADFGSGPDPLGQIMPRFYLVQDNGTGKGVEMSFEAGGVDGHLLVAVGAARTAHSSGQVTEGRVRLEAEATGVVIHDEIYDAGEVQFVPIEFLRARTIALRMTLADDLPTSARLHFVYGYQKAPDSETAPILGSVLAGLMDSWSQFPLPQGDEVPPLRPDGVTQAEGMQFLLERIREVMAEDGMELTILNFGKGSMTTVWGLRQVGAVIASPIPVTDCLVNFAINDRNSMSVNEPVEHDFDPDNLWQSLPRSSGGVDGRVTSAAHWADNMREICRRLIAARIRPIVLLPPDTGSNSQSYELQRDFLPRLLAGFDGPPV